jgi:cation:H+ antiporter
MMAVVALLVGLVGLAFGGDLLVRGAVQMSKALKVSTAVAGLTVVAFGTSAPEFVVSMLAAMQKQADIAAANVIGSNIFNICAILGVCALLRPLKVLRIATNLEWPVLFIASLGTAILFWDQKLGPWEGILFLGFLGVFLFFRGYLAWKESLAERLNSSSNEEDKSPSLWKSLGWVVAGMFLLTLGAKWMLKGAVELAEMYGISERIIGLTIVSVGTGLPELAASVVACVRRHDDIAIGNIIGSNLLNLLWVLGSAAIVYPLHVHETLARVDVWWMVAVTVLLFFLMKVRQSLSRLSGVILLLSYVGYLVYLLVRG